VGGGENERKSSNDRNRLMRLANVGIKGCAPVDDRVL